MLFLECVKVRSYRGHIPGTSRRATLYLRVKERGLKATANKKTVFLKMGGGGGGGGGQGGRKLLSLVIPVSLCYIFLMQNISHFSVPPGSCHLGNPASFFLFYLLLYPWHPYYSPCPPPPMNRETFRETILPFSRGLQ